jgi:hypothetical protein
MRRTFRFYAVPVVAVALLAADARAWHGKGHERAARFALAAASDANLPPQLALPKFISAGADQVAHCSQDPDIFTRPIAPPQLHNGESPEHYFDIEPLGAEKPPELRYDFLELCAAKGLKPSKVGLLPYAVTEWTQRLTVALAEHRKWPEDENIRRKCLVYAGILSHYAADLCQPLHTTVHYDGRLKADGNSPRSGIHGKLDALLGKANLDEKAVLKDLKPAPFDKLFPSVMEQVGKSNAMVDGVYELEKLLPDIDAAAGDDARLTDFAKERMRACAEFTASLYLTAWRDSRAIKLPDWHKR